MGMVALVIILVVGFNYLSKIQNQIPAPSLPPQPTANACASDSDCPSGYSCIDTSPVSQVGHEYLRCWKNGSPSPICLSGETHISTPQGDVLVKNIKEGDLVWSEDSTGKKVAAKILVAAHTMVPRDHHVVELVLADGREVLVSPGHKVADGRTIGALLVGDELDGSVVKSTTRKLYRERYTYDILPATNTGFYWGNEVLLRSTLKE